MKGSAVRNVPRADASRVEPLGRYGVATLHEAQGRTGLLKTYMRPIYAGASCWGSAATILGHPATSSSRTTTASW